MTVAPTVTVVIPTLGRGSLMRAVETAASQTAQPLQIVVAFDGDPSDAPELAERVAGVEVRLVSTGGRGHANFARNLGVQRAAGDLIAFLDDDDEWLPEKLEQQLAAVSTLTDDNWICATACEVVLVGGATAWPALPPDDGESIADYLLSRRLRNKKPFLQTSSWLVPRTLLERFPLDETIEHSLHDDLDWLITTEHAARPRLVFVPQRLVRYTTTSPDSFATRFLWRDSLQWISRVELPVTRRQRGDFVLSNPLRNALRTRGRLEGVKVLAAAAAVGRPSVPGWLQAVAVIARGR